jgi:hypothetical protein
MSKTLELSSGDASCAAALSESLTDSVAIPKTQPGLTMQSFTLQLFMVSAIFGKTGTTLACPYGEAFFIMKPAVTGERNGPDKHA